MNRDVKATSYKSSVHVQIIIMQKQCNHDTCQSDVPMEGSGTQIQTSKEGNLRSHPEGDQGAKGAKGRGGTKTDGHGHHKHKKD